ncbi:polysaccharide pyruvyl transferase family protein [Paracoccus sp. (in: a-proteobacteria)]|uniref:polysaccharide pyruvyl transferase family protein n=1 Tax=Paracoccus sp. TaxID=267 RepID=UPI0026DFFBB2|nr:polysaccharide pyruvyl transferase family protein [Paracoccus sp. (in: a-proteobacteria)]MDO5646733.1 polysaccharide pyruvyl transferase family protein [Paracoccus sp. (in: a-proteobacteria)]
MNAAAERSHLTPAQGYTKPSRPVRALMRLGLLQGRRMYWWWGDKINFGDWVGPLIYEWRTGRRPIFCNSRGSSAGHYYVTAGSVLSFGHQAGRGIVWGSGVISGDAEIARPKVIHAVRGPLTRGRCLDLGYDCPPVYGDPGILVPQVLGLVPSQPRYKLGIIPHFREAAALSAHWATNPDVCVIDVLTDVETVARQIADCAVVVSSSLHGLIVSHAMNIPAGWVRFQPGDHLDRWKFHDYYASGGVTDDIAPVMLGADAQMADLITVATNAPRPQLEPLMQPLLDCCPF